MKEINTLNLILLIIYIGICTAGIILNIDNTVEKSVPKPIQIYYEYKIIGNDTIPIDTIYYTKTI